jgi:hypothetical protein
MFRKLIKYEFKATGRLVPFVYLATLVMALINYGISQIGIGWLFGISMVILILLGVTAVIVTYVLIISRYYKNLYGQEGYLMHTLPVKPYQLLASKAVVSFIWMMLSYLVVAGVVFGIVVSVMHEQGTSLATTIEQSGLSLQFLGQLGFALAIALVLSGLYQLAQFFFAMTFGSTARFHKLGIGGPVIVYLAGNVILQALGALFMIIVPLGFQMTMNPAGMPTTFRLVNQGMLQSLLHPNDPTVVIGLGSYLIGLVATFALFAVTARLIRRQTSLR